ncbi:MAG: nucleotidyl transferase AbiEii/AbiGii toxin family protein [Porphyromonadaceae bacterium]|nr:nucleotidyl transferase AbiEii/AbiGii toxin family protein [Porphyromonadaceae bacterium]
MEAKNLGFIRDTYEKVCRLSSVLSFIQSDPLLKESLALKGGTAINLTILDLPRLSVDIDLDYAKSNKRGEMMSERADITEIIRRYMAAEGYELSDRSKTFHSLDSFFFVYINSGGVRDNIKIELNYSLRCHLFPLVHKNVKMHGFLSAAEVLSVAPMEIFAGKIVALLSRAAARDLYDINNMLNYGLFDEAEQDMLRRCAVYYSAVCGDLVPETFDVGRIDSITKYQIKTGLFPVIRKTERFDLAAAQNRVKSYLAKLLVTAEAERSFWDAFRNKDYRPELLFDGEVLERVKNHPMALWKCREV